EARDATLAEGALNLLAGTQKLRRPRKRKGLVAVLHSHFAKKIPEAELQHLIDELIDAGRLSDNGGPVPYHFLAGGAPRSVNSAGAARSSGLRTPPAPFDSTCV